VDIEITPRGYEPSRRVEAQIEDRADKFTKYVHDLLRVRFTLVGEKVANICEIHLHANGKDFHAKASSDDMLVSVDSASSSMEEQLRRDKAKRVDQKTRPAPGYAKTSAAALEASLKIEEDPGGTITGDQES